MPGYRAHMLCAAILYVLLVFCIYTYVQSGLILCGGFIAILVGALFPDIDTKSKGQHYLYWVYAALLASFLILYWRDHKPLWLELIVCLSVVTIAPMLGRHRGITHAPPFILLLGLLMWIIVAGFYPLYTAQLFFFSACFVLGAFSHVWLDKRRIFFFR